MSHIIDRRLNSKGKNLSNKQRFVKRAREEIKKNVQDIANNRNIKDIDMDGAKIKVKSKSLEEPSFSHDPNTGERNYIHPGNDTFEEGDSVKKPQKGGDKGGPKAGEDGEGDDEFVFVLSRDEFLDLFFEDLELPDLVKKSLKEIRVKKNKRGGFTNVGNPATLDVKKTLKQAMGRRFGLHRPKKEDIIALELEIANLENDLEEDIVNGDILREECKLFLEEDKNKIALLKAKLESLNRKFKAIAWIDPIDTRYKLFVPVMQPNVQAAVFCLMDVSGSMGEHEKEIAKIFFTLLHLFVRKKYDKVELVFIRHTHNAQEVDEDTFFYDTGSGGTIVSAGLKEVASIIESRYDSNWNIYVAQVSDGDNWTGDNEKCRELLLNKILPRVQYYAYLEVKREVSTAVGMYYNRESDLWVEYEEIAELNEKMAMKRVSSKTEIFPIFRELFQKER